MQKTKAKHGASRLIQMLPFALIWAFSVAAGGLVSGALLRIFIFPVLPNEAGAVVNNITPAILMGFIQVLLVERLLKRSMRGWMLYTTISGLITLFLVHVVARSMIYNQNPSFSPELYMLVNYIAFSAVTPLLQFFWLRRHVNQAWLWPVTSILFTALIALKGFISSDYGSRYPWIEGFAYSIIQASIMHYLWSHPKATEKAKVDFAADDDSDDARIERLEDQERAHRNPLWHQGDEQTLQSEA